MDSIGSKINIEYLRRRPQKGTPANANCERNEYVGKFTDKLNLNRGSYPKLGYSRVAKVLQHLTTQDLHAFYKTCENANNFGQCFWGLLKLKK